MKHIAWLAFVLTALASLAVPAAGAEMTGRAVFDHYCTYCHGSEDGPGTMQLRRTRGNDKALLAERTDLAPQYIEYIVRHGLRSMPPFVPSDLTEAKLAALVEFLTSPLPRRR
jgi:mono/diheme cytochrome c family protein